MPSTPKDPSAIRSFHAHVYFDANSLVQARALCEAAAQRFDLDMGQVHEKLVGPHPDWSCQLAFTAERFGTVVPWLALNRNGLVVFVHPETGDDLADHRDHAIWLGDSRPLDLRMFGWPSPA
jgi:aromatic ring-cleaving dioxygenase